MAASELASKPRPWGLGVRFRSDMANAGERPGG